jgi:hypothetical protein
LYLTGTLSLLALFTRFINDYLLNRLGYRPPGPCL